MVKVSLVLLTCGRKEAIVHSLGQNILNAGHDIFELIHVDNGSGGQFCHWFETNYRPSIQVINETNIGVAKGYNQGMALARGTHICITGCDRQMPNLWLKHMVEAMEKIPNTGVISLYTQDKPDEDKTQRYVGEPKIINGVKIQESLPCEARLHSRQLLMDVGYFREDFGLYGHEDCEWADRVNRYTYKNNLINYILPDLARAYQLPHGDEGEYKAMKKKQNDDPRKAQLVKWCHTNENPYYNPFAKIEEDLLGKV